MGYCSTYREFSIKFRKVSIANHSCELVVDREEVADTNLHVFDKVNCTLADTPDHPFPLQGQWCTESKVSRTYLTDESFVRASNNRPGSVENTGKIQPAAWRFGACFADYVLSIKYIYIHSPTVPTDYCTGLLAFPFDKRSNKSGAYCSVSL